VPGTLTGTAFGDRTFNYNGKGFCIDMVITLFIHNIKKGKQFDLGLYIQPCKIVILLKERDSIGLFCWWHL
jgi:hypothetical protein